MTKTQKNILMWVMIIGLIIIATPWFGALYEWVIGRPVSSGFWGPGNPEYIVGFLFALAFVPVLILTIFRKSYQQILALLVLVLLIDISVGAWRDGVLIDLSLALVAWILGQAILLVKKILAK